MYLELLYRIKASPLAHLGCRSLVRLEAFQLGYGFFPQISGARDFSFDAFRDWVLTRYRPAVSAELGVTQILLQAAEDDERAFDLFFEELAAALASRADALKPREPRFLVGDPLPASGFLDVLRDRPAMFLGRVSVGALRAFLDGYGLAADEEGHVECLDLDGFEHWVRKQLDLKGMFRWENAVLAQFGGDQSIAFQWAVRELTNYRASKGPLSERRYEVIQHE
ncbi:MAG TPA: hypothetical protein VN893_24895 [Bryobacteraceae bacterium]|nr:hypothetical protein [Bryobacteraceae bacterium]